MTEDTADTTIPQRGRIPYDEPASLTVPGAPENVPLWEYLIEVAMEKDHWQAAADLVGLSWQSVATACCRDFRAGCWPVEMLPQGKNYSPAVTKKERKRYATQAAKRKAEKEATAAIRRADAQHSAAIAAKRPRPLVMDCTPPNLALVGDGDTANPNDRTGASPYVIPRQKVYDYMEDPVKWCEEMHPFIESKKYGQVPFKPWFFQREIMRAVMVGGVHLYLKSRQVAVTTPIMVAWGHAMLYQYAVTGKPFHGHVFANKEDKALGIVKKARLAVNSSELTVEERRGLKGCDHTTNVKKTFYRQPGADNHIFAHTTTGVDIRGDDVNCVLIDEADFLMYLDLVWTSCIEAVEVGDYLSLVSSINPHEPVTEFRRMFFEQAPGLSWHTTSIDWRANEERLVNREGENDGGEEWEREQRASMGDATFDVAHNLKIRSAGSSLLKVATLRRFAAKCEYWGNEVRVGHRYTKGLDIGGQGNNDPCVFHVIDMTVRPAQSVYERDFTNPEVKCYPGEEPLEALRREIEEEDAKWDGPTFVDCTHNRAFVGLLKLKHKQAVQLTSGATADNRRYDAGSGMRVRSKARVSIVNDFLISLDTSELVVFEQHTPALWAALETAKFASVKQTGPDKGRGVKQDASKAKRQGKNPDHFDAAMLARMGMGRVRGGVRRAWTEDGEEIEQGDGGGGGRGGVMEEERRGGRELRQGGPGDRLADVRGTASWRQGDKF